MSRLAAIVVATIVAAPASAAAEDARPGGFARPHGSLLYATSLAELGVIAGHVPGVPGLTTGLHYAERGALFANLLAAASPGIGAQAQANATGRTVTYTQPDPDDFGPAGLTIDVFSPRLGGSSTGLSIDFFGIISIGETLPWSVDLGMTFVYHDGEQASDDVGGLGLFAGVIAPVTRFAQVEARGRAMIGSTAYIVEVGGVANLSDRFYARGAFMLTPDGSGVVFGGGGRL